MLDPIHIELVRHLVIGFAVFLLVGAFVCGWITGHIRR